MKSVKCLECGFVGWADSDTCKRCGVARSPETTDTTYAPLQPRNVNYHEPIRTVYANPVEGKKGLAIASLVMGIVNFFTLGVLGVGIVVGVIISLVALSKIKRDPSQYGGRQFAVAGLITNIASIVTIIPFLLIAAIAVPNLMAARRAANEGSAISSMRTIHSAEATYQATHDGGFGSLEELAAVNLISSELGSGTRNGYKFKIETTPASTDRPAAFQAISAPTNYPSSGRRSFYVDETGVIRAADSQGADAGKLDQPLEAEDYNSPSAPPARRYNTKYGY